MIPDKLIVGVGVIASEKEAVIVTTSEFETVLPDTVSVKSTVGAPESLIKEPTKIPLP